MCKRKVPHSPRLSGDDGDAVTDVTEVTLEERLPILAAMVTQPDPARRSDANAGSALAPSLHLTPLATSALASLFVATLTPGCLIDRGALTARDSALEASANDASAEPDAFTAELDLVAWWPFSIDDPRKDATERGHTLTNVGVEFDGAVATLGDDDELYTPDAPDLDSVVTLAAWVRPTTRRATRMGVLDRDGIWGVFIQPGGEPTCILYGNAAIAGPPILRNQWTHLACTFEAGTVRFYVNGAMVGEAAGAAMTDNGSRIQIGQNCCDGTDELNGQMSDVRLYARALRAAEIADLATRRSP